VEHGSRRGDRDHRLDNGGGGRPGKGRSYRTWPAPQILLILTTLAGSRQPASTRSTHHVLTVDHAGGVIADTIGGVSAWVDATWSRHFAPTHRDLLSTSSLVRRGVSRSSEGGGFLKNLNPGRLLVRGLRLRSGGDLKKRRWPDLNSSIPPRAGPTEQHLRGPAPLAFESSAKRGQWPGAVSARPMKVSRADEGR
jgi:hypothetical protein